MAGILKEVANINNPTEKDMEITLSEMEKGFDDIAKDEKGQKKLVQALEDNLSKEGSEKYYKFDYAGMIKDIVEKEEGLSEMDENAIKVYQLCKNLELKKA
jgi:predicted transport protein